MADDAKKDKDKKDGGKKMPPKGRETDAWNQG
jgi:hypothetical protein